MQVEWGKDILYLLPTVMLSVALPFLYATGGEAIAVVRNHLLNNTAIEKAEMTFQAHCFSAGFCGFPALKE